MSTRVRIFSRRNFRLLLVAVFIFAGIILWCGYTVNKVSSSKIFKDTSSVPSRYAALVLGARVYRNGNLSGVVMDRVLCGIRLYQSGKVKKILLSGDHGRKDYDEVNAMRGFMMKNGIPAEDIFMDHAGFDTYDSMVRARDVFQVKDMIIVSQQFHLPRAVYIARRLGMDAVGVPADGKGYGEEAVFYSSLREIPARVKAFMDVEVFHSSPAFLGEVIPITGNGRATEDGRNN